MTIRGCSERALRAPVTARICSLSEVAGPAAVSRDHLREDIRLLMSAYAEKLGCDEAAGHATVARCLAGEIVDVAQSFNGSARQLKLAVCAKLNCVDGAGRAVRIADPTIFGGWSLARFKSRSSGDYQALFIGLLRRFILRGLKAEPDNLLAELLSDTDTRALLRGVPASLQLASLLYAGNLKKAHRKMRDACQKLKLDVRALDWRVCYPGTVREFRREIWRVKRNFAGWCAGDAPSVDAYSALPANLQGIWGYVAYAEACTGGNMLEAHLKMSAACRAAGVDFRKLRWGNQFKGTTSEYRVGIQQVAESFPAWCAAAPAIKDRYVELPASLKGIWGYIAYAEAAAGGDMLKAFVQMSALCGAAGVDFQDLGWGRQFPGSSADFREELGLVLNLLSVPARGEVSGVEHFSLLPDGLRGILGYIAYAEVRTDGDMSKASVRMKALCEAAGLSFDALGWGCRFSGTAQEARELLRYFHEHSSVLVGRLAGISYFRFRPGLGAIRGLRDYETPDAGPSQHDMALVAQAASELAADQPEVFPDTLTESDLARRVDLLARRVAERFRDSALGYDEACGIATLAGLSSLISSNRTADFLEAAFMAVLLQARRSVGDRLRHIGDPNWEWLAAKVVA